MLSVLLTLLLTLLLLLPPPTAAVCVLLQCGTKQSTRGAVVAVTPAGSSSGRAAWTRELCGLLLLAQDSTWPQTTLEAVVDGVQQWAALSPQRWQLSTAIVQCIVVRI